MQERVTVVHHPGPVNGAVLQLLENGPPAALDGVEAEGLAEEAGTAHPASSLLRLRSRPGLFSGLERTSLALLDRAARQLHVFELDFFPAVGVERIAPPTAPDLPLPSKEHRQLVVRELGTRKRQKMLQRQEAAPAASAADGLRMSQAMQSPSEEAVPAENGRLSRLRALLPAFNPYATHPKSIYQLSSLLPAQYLEAVDAVAIAEQAQRGGGHPVLVRIVAHAGVRPTDKPQNWQRYLALLHHAMTLFTLRRIRVPLRELAQRNGLDPAVVRALAERFWERGGDALTLGQFQRFRFAAFIAVLVLLLFGLECRVDDLREGLHLRPQELNVLLRSVGCAVEEREGVRIARLQRIRL